MKFTIIAFTLPIIALGACTPKEHFVQQNMLYNDFEVDRSACEAKAIQEIGSSNKRSAELAVHGLKISYGRKDANSSARVRHYEACMLSKGYVRVQFSRCPDSKAAQLHGVGPLNVNRRVAISQNTCTTEDKKGRVVFSNLGVH